jgi:predicted nuclease of predicted toxin-antitoxin system
MYVAEMSPGVTDDDVLRLATEEGALLVTSDKDFGELVFRQGRAHSGVVLLRLHGTDPSQKGTLTSAVIAEHGEKLANAFSVLEHRQVRIRRGPFK